MHGILLAVTFHGFILVGLPRIFVEQKERAKKKMLFLSQAVCPDH